MQTSAQHPGPMNFKNGDLAIIVAGPWVEAIGKIVKIVMKCRVRYGKGVSCDGLHYWLDGGAPIYVVRPLSGATLPAGNHSGDVQYRLKRRPYCGCWMRPVLRAGGGDYQHEWAQLPQRAASFDALPPSPPARYAPLNINALRRAIEASEES